MDCDWNDILFFPGEDAEALKSRFVELWAAHGDRFPVYQLAQNVFKNLKEPGLRAGKAAEVWSNDFDVVERVRQLQLKGPEKPDDDEIALRRRAVAIADDQLVAPKDRLTAIRLAGELQGFVKKSVEAKLTGFASNDSSEFLKALAGKLPA